MGGLLCPTVYKSWTRFLHCVHRLFISLKCCAPTMQSELRQWNGGSLK
jgi:hypothetical protein